MERIYLNDAKKEEFVETLNQLYVQREFFNGHEKDKYDAYNLISIFATTENDQLFIPSGPIEINVSLDENGFKYINNKSGYIEFINDNQVLDIKNTEKLRSFIKKLITKDSL